MNIYKINNNKFKTIYFSYNFTLPVKKEDISYYNVLSSILSKTNKVYRTQKEINEYLYSLYGANFDVNVEKIGDLFNIEFKIQFVNDKFLENYSNVLEKSLNFLYTMIYEPIFMDESLDEEVLLREKQSVLEKIFTRKDDKLKYAVNKTEELLCENDPFGTYIYGEEEVVKSVKIDDIKKYYKKMINEGLINIIISGNLDGYDNINGIVEYIFKNKQNDVKKDSKFLINVNNNFEFNESNKIREIFDEADTVQSVITYGLRVNDFKIKEFFALNTYNAILGATPSSKLFQNFREKESLAYTVRSRYYRYKDFIIIYAGINYNNYEKAKEVLNRELKDIQLGNISEEEFNAAKESLISDLLEIKDSKAGLLKMFISNLFFFEDNLIDINYMIEEIKKITKEQVVEVAKKVKLDTIYFLGGKQDE